MMEKLLRLMRWVETFVGAVLAVIVVVLTLVAVAAGLCGFWHALQS